MRPGLSVLAVGLALASCDAPSPAPVQNAVALDVVFDGDLVTIHAAPLKRSCECTSGFLDAGECGATFNDALRCTCDDVGVEPREMFGCVEQVIIRSGGREESLDLDQAFAASIAGEASVDSVVVVRGCGRDVEVALDVVPAPVLRSATDLARITEGRADVLVDGDADRFQGCVNQFFSESCCDGPGPRVELPVPFRFERGDRSRLVAMNGPFEVAGDGGPVRAWRTIAVDLGPAPAVPEPLDDGRLAYTADRTVSWGVGQGFFADRMIVDPLALDVVTFEGADGSLELTSTTATVSTLDEEGEIAVDAPLPLTLGTFDGLDYSTQGGIVMTRRDDPAVSRVEEFELFVSLPALARP